CAMCPATAIVWQIFFYDVPRPAAHPETFALPDRVKPDPLVFAEFFLRFDIPNLALFFPKVKADELRIFDFAEETDPLTIAPVFVRQIKLSRFFADLCFHQMPNRK